MRSILVANRSHERAVALAEQFHGRAVTFDTFRQEMLEADIVISSTSAPHLILKKEDVPANLWQPGKFVHPHDACFDADGNIFVAEWVVGGRVTKLRKLS